VAHREEILKQALLTFRGILKDSNFGDLWVGNNKPDKYNHLFISVQTMNSQRANLDLSPDYYDFIIIDEVHHIAASSYRPILSSFNPKILLGLTATPERHDGANILDDFSSTIAAELRLPDAINRRFLCPFQYFGVDDNVDISHVKWDRGKYDPAELTKIYLGNDHRCKHILRSMQSIIGNIHRIKALAFCVSQEHAKYMVEKFILNGVKAAVLTSENSSERTSLRNDLIQGRINVLFVVDIFNEGVDIPEIDTVLFLRPTESLTIFLQQLGRGLRIADGKECLTVLDFVGNARPEYDFSQKFRALVGKTHISTIDEIENDFPHLPLGCSIVLQKKAREVILNNIRNAIINQRRLLSLIQSFRNHSTLNLNLSNFLRLNPQVAIEDIYKSKVESGGGWSRLCVHAGVADYEIDNKIENAVYKGISKRILQCTSISYLQFILSLINKGFKWDNTDPVQNQMALMLHYDFWQKPGNEYGFETLSESVEFLGEDKCLVSELREVIEIKLEDLETAEHTMDIGEPIAIKLHARYSRDQILSAFGANTFNKKSSSKEGVVDFKDKNIELLFVTLQKTDKKFSPTTLYHDYAISENLFHWQSQNAATPEKGKGLSYIQQQETGKNFILFVREQSYDEYNRVMGFVNLGTLTFQSYTGSKPMSIIWKLENPMPAWMWKDAAKLAIA
jgi:superfamily II DNA or RNA helicase